MREKEKHIGKKKGEKRKNGEKKWRETFEETN